MLNHHKLNVTCWDTAGLEEYDGIRKLVYKNAHMVVITFAINDSDSLENVEEKVTQYKIPSFYKLTKIQWIKEVRGQLPNVPVILAGLQLDLRGDLAAAHAAHANSVRITTHSEVCQR